MESYVDSMKRTTDRAVFNQAVGKQSELKKPYASVSYGEMEYLTDAPASDSLKDGQNPTGLPFETDFSVSGIDTGGDIGTTPAYFDTPTVSFPVLDAPVPPSYVQENPSFDDIKAFGPNVGPPRRDTIPDSAFEPIPSTPSGVNPGTSVVAVPSPFKIFVAPDEDLPTETVPVTDQIAVDPRTVIEDDPGGDGGGGDIIGIEVKKEGGASGLLDVDDIRLQEPFSPVIPGGAGSDLGGTGSGADGSIPGIPAFEPTPVSTPQTSPYTEDVPEGYDLRTIMTVTFPETAASGTTIVGIGRIDSWLGINAIWDWVVTSQIEGVTTKGIRKISASGTRVEITIDIGSTVETQNLELISIASASITTERPSALSVVEITGATSLVPNFDMELNSNWTNFGSGSSAQSSVQKHTGDFSWNITDGNPAGDTSIISDSFTTEAGKTYSVSVWYYSTNAFSDIGDNADLFTFVYRGAAGAGSPGGFRTVTRQSGIQTIPEASIVVGSWTEITWTFTDPEPGAFAKVVLEAAGATSWDVVPSIYFDDIVILEI